MFREWATRMFKSMFPTSGVIQIDPKPELREMDTEKVSHNDIY